MWQFFLHSKSLAYHTTIVNVERGKKGLKGKMTNVFLYFSEMLEKSKWKKKRKLVKLPRPSFNSPSPCKTRKAYLSSKKGQRPQCRKNRKNYVKLISQDFFNTFKMKAKSFDLWFHEIFRILRLFTLWYHHQTLFNEFSKLTALK